MDVAGAGLEMEPQPQALALSFAFADTEISQEHTTLRTALAYLVNRHNLPAQIPIALILGCDYYCLNQIHPVRSRDRAE